jgi:lipoprotein-anchoring transpeptidase ErfK/SrfK
MSRSTIHSRKRPLYLGLILVLGCATIAAAAWTVNSTSALASVSSLNTIATPTQRKPFGYAEIDKPTYTALPSIIPSSTFMPTEVSTDIPQAMAYAEVIQDTPSPEYVATTIEQPFQETDSSASNYNGNKYILIDISEQHMYVFEGDTLVFSFVSSTGLNNATRVGNFSVLDKIPNAYGETWNIWMPNWLGIYWAGSLQNGIHALPILPNGAQLWAGYLGTPISFGCIVIGADESQLLYDWAEIGTPVDIQW